MEKELVACQDPFEMMIGAILTQNTAWTNVKRPYQTLVMGYRQNLDAVSKRSLQKSYGLVGITIKRQID